MHGSARRLGSPLHPSPTARAATAASIVAVTVLVVLATGCATSARDEAPAREVDLGAFSRSTAHDVVEVTDVVEVDVEPADDGGEATTADASGGAETGDDPATPTVPLGAGSAPAPRRVQPGQRMIVDSMVGQVNGRPIFADDFFEPIEDQIIAIRQDSSTMREFAMQVNELVMAELQLFVVNALFLAEAEVGLTQNEQQGIFAWLQQVEEQLISQNRGNEATARRAILEEEGVSLERHLKGIRDRAMIQKLLSERIAPRVIVSWHDVERRYRQRIREYQPNGTVVLARIMLRTETEADEIADVTARLDAGDPFMAIAEALGGRQGRWQEFEVVGEGLGAIELANAELQGRVRSMNDVGDTVGPFEIGRFTWWLHVAELDRPPARSLYDPDVQRELAQQIRAERSTEEQNRYIAMLLERGIYDELNDMAERLMRIAMLRYGE